MNKICKSSKIKTVNNLRIIDKYNIRYIQSLKNKFKKAQGNTIDSKEWLDWEHLGPQDAPTDLITKSDQI